MSVWSWTNIIWWRALVDPTLTSTRDLTALKLDLSSDIIVDAKETVDEYVDWYTALLSFPGIWPGDINLYAPVPIDVVPNPTIFDLTFIGFDELLI